MRLATFNLLNGMSLQDGLVDTERLRAAVRLLDADVLGIQEVDRGQARSGHVDQTAEVAEAMGARDHRFVPALTGTPGFVWQPAPMNDDPALPSYGVGLLSRLPVRRWHVLRLAATPIVMPLLIPGPKVLWLKDEPRVVVAAELEGLTVATTHLSFVPGWNVKQLRQVRTWLAGLPGPQVLLGDLNLPAGLARKATGWTPLVTAATYPAPKPKVQLDHVLASVPLTVRTAQAHALALSDHRALTVDVGLLSA